MNVLAISAHPDDIEINCAGTLKRFIDKGDNVIMCNLCNGNMGHVLIEPDKLRQMRLNESKKSAGILGAEHICMDVGDLQIYHEDKTTRDKLTDIIRYAQPDIIITHAPNDYMPDHIAVSKLVFASSFCASLPHYNMSKDMNIVDICPIFYMDNLGGFNFNPTEYVDISSAMQTKLDMLRCHQSQIKWMSDHDGIDFCSTVQTFAHMRGLQCGVMYAEGFTQLQGWQRMTTKRLLP